jgi:hypothetical protein
VRLLEQMELQLEELEAAASEDAIAAAAQAQTVKSFERKRPVRKPFPADLPRERVVLAARERCPPCCGSGKLSKLGEDVTETLEVIPRRWKVIQTVREKYTCRECEKPRAGSPVALGLGCRTDRLHAPPLGPVRPLPRRRPDLSYEQRGRAGLRGFALGRKAWLFAGSDRRAERAAAVATLITTAKLNDVDPLAWLADVLARIAGSPQPQLPELPPWKRRAPPQAARAA